MKRLSILSSVVIVILLSISSCNKKGNTVNTSNEIDYVDLGLSVMWATCNIGASVPEEVGNYYAWGETENKRKYTWSTYKYCNRSSDKLTKYCYNKAWGNDKVDNKGFLDLSDDVANIKYGGTWHIPTIEELEELHECCTWSWTTKNGVFGYKITSNISGFTDRSIFIPVTGYYDIGGLEQSIFGGYYWSNSLSVGGGKNASSMYFSSEYVDWYHDLGRNCGLPVRPVRAVERNNEYNSNPITSVSDNVVSSNRAIIPDDFVLVPSGTLYKYRDSYDNDRQEYVYKDVPLDSFYICIHEVTQREYLNIMGDNPSQIIGDDLPVNTVQFIDAINYCNARSVAEGYEGFYTIEGNNISIKSFSNGYRLPNEYEWAYASRKDEKTKTKYAGGDNIKEIAWYGGNSKDVLHEVCTKKPNGRGIYDLNGNVSEWLWGISRYSGNYFFIGSDFLSYIELGEADVLASDYINETNGFRVALIVEKNNSNINTDLSLRKKQLKVYSKIEEKRKNEEETAVRERKRKEIDDYIKKADASYELYKRNSNSNNANEALHYYKLALETIQEIGGATRTIKYINDCITDIEKGHEGIDLGLSVMWATCNIGASKPEEYGDYYAWGEIDTYYDYGEGESFSYYGPWKPGKNDGFDWDSYKYCGGSQNTLNKYCSLSEYGYNEYKDERTVLEINDDIAYERWGLGWRIPTIGEIEELINRCTWIWSQQNGVEGYIVTSKISGFTDKSIFLPAAGSREYTNSKKIECGYYWSRNLNTNKPNMAYVLYFNKDGKLISEEDRCRGCRIRPVHTP